MRKRTGSRFLAPLAASVALACLVAGCAPGRYGPAYDALRLVRDAGDLAGTVIGSVAKAKLRECKAKCGADQECGRACTDSWRQACVTWEEVRDRWLNPALAETAHVLEQLEKIEGPASDAWKAVLMAGVCELLRVLDRLKDTLGPDAAMLARYLEPVKGWCK